MTDGNGNGTQANGPQANGNGTHAGGQANGQQASGQGKSAKSRRRRGQNRPAPPDLWRRVGPLAEPAPIPFPDDPGMLLRSLGDPPIGTGGPAGHQFNKVAERAAGVAYALALSVDLVTDDPDVL